MTAGCTFLAAGPQVELAERARAISGTISGVRDAPVLVVALREPDLRPVDFFVVEEDGPYFLVVQAGLYRVFAFEDRNGDRILQPGEPALMLPDENTIIDTTNQFVHSDVDGEFSTEPGGSAQFPGLSIVLSNPDLEGRIAFGGPPPGFLASLDDARFSRENATQGYWNPIDFLRDPC